MNLKLLANTILQSKSSQVLNFLDKPLIIFNLDGNNKNYKMFTLIEEHSAPSVFIILPNGNIHLIVSSIETALPSSLNKVTIHAYGKKKLFDILKELISQETEVYVEFSTNYPNLDYITYGLYKKLKQLYKLISAEDILWKIRSVKTDTEIKLIKKAIYFTHKIFKEIEEDISPGITEKEIMNKLQMLLIKYNLEFSFKPIIASGKRANDPHPVRFTNKKLKKGEHLILDLGVFYHCFTSDITRTYKIGGDITKEKLFEINNEMVNKLTTLKLTNMSPCDLAEIMDNISHKYNVYSLQKHSYGHGIGVEVHDVYPSIASANNKKLTYPKFQDNMVFAFEPGFYTSKNSFRIEDNFVIKNGHAIKL